MLLCGRLADEARSVAYIRDGPVGAARRQPAIDLGRVRVGGRPLVMLMAMDGQTFLLLPALHGGDIAFQIRGDLFPGVESIVGS